MLTFFFQTRLTRDCRESFLVPRLRSAGRRLSTDFLGLEHQKDAARAELSNLSILSIDVVTPQNDPESLQRQKSSIDF